MSLIDKIAAAVEPPESDEDRETARRNAEAMAGEGSWIADVIQHHRRIETAFAQALGAADGATRTTALKALAVLLTAHANAEESVLYPAMAGNNAKGEATIAYEEQAMTKIEMAKLELFDPMSAEWREKLEHVRGAVLHHAYEEEGKWFPKLHQEMAPRQRDHVAVRFAEEFERNGGNHRRVQPG